MDIRIPAAVGAAVTLMAVFAVPAALTAPAAAAASSQAKAPGPRLGLISVQRTVTIPEIGNQPVVVDPAVWVTSYGSDFRLNVQRANYTGRVTVTQIISTPRGTEE